MSTNTLIPITAKTANIQGYHLSDSQDMFNALNALVGLGYTGMISCQLSSGTASWTLNLSNNQQNSNQMAYMNDWIVIENGAVATVCPAVNFATMYTVPS